MCQNKLEEVTVNKICCPLCNNDLKEVSFPSPNNGRSNMAYAWICESCPTVGIEWWDKTDSKVFLEHLELPEHKSLDLDVSKLKSIECPICTDDDMVLRIVQSTAEIDQGKHSYQWVCGTCPAIMAYVPNSHDKNALNDYFYDRKNLVRDYSEEVHAAYLKKQEEENERRFNERWTRV
ncbi:hypothetical protein CN918_28730 [Priestia megaterium]|nr:hypothetical protein CN918_28730 [Priestia megaterium]